MSHLPTGRGFPPKVDALMAGVPVAEISVKQLLCLHLPPYLHITFSLNRFISKNSIWLSITFVLFRHNLFSVNPPLLIIHKKSL